MTNPLLQAGRAEAGCQDSARSSEYFSATLDALAAVGLAMVLNAILTALLVPATVRLLGLS
jgi:hypothetical protein